MYKNYTITLVLALSFLTANAQTIWDGEDITVTKEANADFTLEENQDRITDNIWITRGNTMGIYNIAVEDSYTENSSPLDTEWAFGTTADIGTLSFADWETAIDNNPPASVNMPMVLHLITDDVYIDLTFTQWGSGGGAGGSFAYTRSSDPNLGLAEINNAAKGLFPNPAQNVINLPNLKQETNYVIFDILGKEVLAGKASQNASISVNTLTSGVYFIRLEGATATRFVKQ